MRCPSDHAIVQGIITPFMILRHHLRQIFALGLMLPLCLLYAGIGTSITGLIVRVPALVYSPLVAFLVAVYMLMVLTNGGRVAPEWNLYFGFPFLLMMVIPGHLLNKKAAAYAC